MARNTFNWSAETWVDIDINYDEALEAIGVAYIQEWLAARDAARPPAADPTALLDDPTKRLELIVALRKMGYAVESS